MKRFVFYWVMIITVSCCILSCKDDKDNHKERWMMTNIGAFNQIKNQPGYFELLSPGNEGSIYCKVLQSGTGTDTVRYTSSVRCYYKAWFVADYENYKIKAGDTFDRQLFDDGLPIRFTISTDVLPGRKTALQHMVKGDKWEIWMPYQLGYGRDDYKASSGSRTIPGYSTIVYEIEIVDVTTIDN